ncbi:lecithin:cholesterol acyltransferase [Flavobacterium sp. 1]|uniref:lipase/acyltransferase domain-containing protein n=1 Tax=Flavobacterium sp. 1 TaxID=2035200 RepID=UPI000C23E8A2|nr:alpha/beta hydrolase [Flavobacterium sp. 1]PJJ08789.1 lecithin:cholesterol acyltransferase [Flavobacterium sp. 1]
MKPIIFIPGIQATSLVNSNTFDFNYIWNAYDTLGSSISSSVFGTYINENLQINPLYDQGIETIIERNHIARLPYESAILKLKTKLNCTKAYKDTPIYLFGYDWRMSNMESAKRLKAYIEYLKHKLQDKNIEGFRFITHSMGGLVLTCYLNLLKDDFSRIDKIVMTAPPFLGSPYSLIHMVKGDGGLRSILNWAIGRNEDMRKVIRTYPGVYELLPVYPDALKYIDTDEPLDLLKKIYWQKNIYDDIKDLFDSRLALLNEFRSPSGLKNLSDLPKAIKNKIVIVIGEGDETFTKIKVKKKGDTNNITNLIDLNSLNDGKESGDGTVPFKSSSIYANEIKTLAVKKQNIFDEISNNLDFHGLFLNDSRVRNIIERYLTVEETNPVIKKLENWWDTPDGSVRKV